MKLLKSLQEEQKMTKKKSKKGLIIVIIIAVIVVLAIIGSIIVNAIAGGAGIPVMAATAKIGEIEQTITSSGYITADEKIYYYAPENLKIGEILVESGDQVKKGDVLFKYDETDLNNAIRENELSIIIAQSGYNDKDSNNKENVSNYQNYSYKANTLKTEIAQYEAYIDLLSEDIKNGNITTSRDYVSRIEVYQEQNMSLNKKITKLTSDAKEEEDEDKQKAIFEEIEKLEDEIYLNNLAISQIQTAQQLMSLNPTSDNERALADAQDHLADLNKELAVAEGKRDAAEAGKLSEYNISAMDADNEIQMIKLNSQKEELDAVKNGVIALEDGIVSDLTISTGQSIMAGSLVMTISSTNAVSLDSSLGKSDLKIAEVGQSATVTVLGKEYEAELSHIDRMASSTGNSGATSVGIKITLKNPEGITLGMDGKASIMACHKDSALLVPTEAVNTDREGDFLYVIEDGIAHKKYVTTGISSITEIEIVDGLSEGDQVITMVELGVEDGVAVMPMVMDFEEGEN